MCDEYMIKFKFNPKYWFFHVTVITNNVNEVVTVFGFLAFKTEEVHRKGQKFQILLITSLILTYVPYPKTF